MKAKYPYREGDTVVSHILHALEEVGPCASIHLRHHLRRRGTIYTQSQASAALQRLRRERLTEHDGRWALCGMALQGSLRDPAISRYLTKD